MLQLVSWISSVLLTTSLVCRIVIGIYRSSTNTYLKEQMNHIYLFLYPHLEFLMIAQCHQGDEPVIMFLTIPLLLDV